MHRNQKGFTLVEALLLIIVVVLLSGLGLYSYNSIKKEDAKKAAVSTTAKAETEPKAEADTKKEYVEFQDIGIKIEKTDTIKDFSYEADTDAPKVRYVHSARFDALLKKCGAEVSSDVASHASFAAFSANKGKYGDEEQGPDALVRQFDTFYVSIGYPNGGAYCEGEDFQEQEGELRGALQKELLEALKTVTEL